MSSCYSRSLFLSQLMKEIMRRLPPYQFLIAFPQLISRICHPNSDVFLLLEVWVVDVDDVVDIDVNVDVVDIDVDVMLLLYTSYQTIILKLLENYPQQALWMMIAVSKVRVMLIATSYIYHQGSPVHYHCCMTSIERLYCQIFLVKTDNRYLNVVQILILWPNIIS